MTAHQLFLSSFWDIRTLKKFYTEFRICSTQLIWLIYIYIAKTMPASSKTKDIITRTFLFFSEYPKRSNSRSKTVFNCKKTTIQTHIQGFRRLKMKPAIAAMHGPHSLVRFGDKVRNKFNYRIGPKRSDSVIKLVSVLFGKCTTLVITKC